MIIVGIFLISMFVYGQFQVQDIGAVSKRLTQEADSDSLKAVFEMIDLKIELAQLQLRADRNFALVVGGILSAMGFINLFFHKRRMRKKRIVMYLARKALEDA